MGLYALLTVAAVVWFGLLLTGLLPEQATASRLGIYFAGALTGVASVLVASWISRPRLDQLDDDDLRGDR